MASGACKYLGCYNPNGTEFEFVGPDSIPRLVPICPEHRVELMWAQERLLAIMVTPTEFGLGASRSGGAVWIMNDWLRMLWWPADTAKPHEAGE